MVIKSSNCALLQLAFLCNGITTDKNFSIKLANHHFLRHQKCRRETNKDIILAMTLVFLKQDEHETFTNLKRSVRVLYVDVRFTHALTSCQRRMVLNRMPNDSQLNALPLSDPQVRR